MSCNNELLKIMEKIRVHMALENNIPPDDLTIKEDKEKYYICNGDKKCIFFTKVKESIKKKEE